MANIKIVGVRELKSKLSAYLREAKAGVRIFVSDREAVAAKLHQRYLGRPLESAANPVLAEWIRSGSVRLPTVEKKKVCSSPVRLADGMSLKLLDEA